LLQKDPNTRSQIQRQEKEQMTDVKLCAGCIEMLDEYNPYIVPVNIIEVSMEECENYKIGGEYCD